MKRKIALLLVLAMVFSLVPVSLTSANEDRQVRPGVLGRVASPVTRPTSDGGVPFNISINLQNLRLAVPTTVAQPSPGAIVIEVLLTGAGHEDLRFVGNHAIGAYANAAGAAGLPISVFHGGVTCGRVFAAHMWITSHQTAQIWLWLVGAAPGAAWPSDLAGLLDLPMPFPIRTRVGGTWLEAGIGPQGLPNSIVFSEGPLTAWATGTLPTITGPTSMTLTAGSRGATTEATTAVYTVTGLPIPTVTTDRAQFTVARTGDPPNVDGGEVTLTIPSGLRVGTHRVVVTATNAVGTASRTLTITVRSAGNEDENGGNQNNQGNQGEDQDDQGQQPTPATPRPTPVAAESIIITHEDIQYALAEAEDIIIEAADILTITFPSDAIAPLVLGNNEPLSLQVAVFPPTDSENFELPIEMTLTHGDEIITELDTSIIIEVSLSEFDLEGAHPNRFIVILEDGTLIRGEMDEENQVFTFSTYIVGDFTLAYIPTLTVLRLTIGSYDIYDLVDGGLHLTMEDMTPIIQNNRTLIPLRFIANVLDATVDWNRSDRTVTIVRNNNSLTFAIGEMAPGMDVPAQIMNNRTMVPLRFIAEFFDAVVAWDAGTRSVVIIQK